MSEELELVTRFDFKGKITPLLGFNQGLSKSITLIATSVGAMAALGAGLAKLTYSASLTLDPIIQLGYQTGIATNRLQALAYTASVSGSSAESMLGTIKSLQQKIGQAAIYGSQDFARLGISIYDVNGGLKNADVILQEIGGRLNNMSLSMPQKQALAASLGIDMSLVRMITGASGKITTLERSVRDFGNLNAKQSEEMVKTKDSVTTLGKAFGGLKTQIALGVGPEFRNLMGDLSKFVMRNAPDVINFIDKSIVWFGKFGDSLVRMKKPLLIGGAALAVFGIGFKVATSPVTALTAALTAAYIVVDDLIVAFHGGKSAIRGFFLETTGWDITPSLQKWTKAYLKFLDGYIKFWVKVYDITKWYINTVSENFKWFYDNIVNPIVEALDKISMFVDRKTKAGQATETGWFGASTANDINMPEYTAPVKYTRMGEIIQPGAGTGGTTTQTYTQENKFTIYSNSPTDTANEIKNTLEMQLQTAKQTMQRGR